MANTGSPLSPLACATLFPAEGAGSGSQPQDSLTTAGASLRIPLQPPLWNGSSMILTGGGSGSQQLPRAKQRAPDAIRFPAKMAPRPPQRRRRRRHQRLHHRLHHHLRHRRVHHGDLQVGRMFVLSFRVALRLLAQMMALGVPIDEDFFGKVKHNGCFGAPAVSQRRCYCFSPPMDRTCVVGASAVIAPLAHALGADPRY